ncbi:MAG TPA: hypothetical protein VL096_16895 [Pirellulaceae bacterium]|nr:hypothetical protein [Pirellulaceae bacterium]
MHALSVGLRLLAFGLLIGVGSILLAQPTPEVAKPAPTVIGPPPANNGGGVKEVQPEVFYLKDKDGNLLPVPDLSFEEFKRLYDLSRGLSTEPPPFSLRTMTITGAVTGTKADLAVDIVAVITAKNKAWVRIPLRFPSAVLSEPPKHVGEGEFFFDFEPDGAGYVCWLRAAENSEHKLHCKFAANVQELGAESRLALVTPRAITGSLSLKVPVERADARCVRRTGDDPRLEVVNAKGHSTIEMLGPAGEFQIAWRAGAGDAPRMRQVLEATTAVQVKLEGRRRITCESRIKVRSFGAPIETFSVRLPPDMRLVALEQPIARVTVLEPELDPTSQKLLQVVEVRLATKTNGPVEVPIIAELIRDSATVDQAIEVGGFEVVDAVKQWGTVDLVVEGDLSAIWVEGANIRRVDDTNTDPLRANRSLAKFDFDAQPFTLQVQVVPKRTRVSVEPTYVMYLDGRQARLDATLKYKIRGAKTYQVEHDFTGWTIDRVGPDNLVQGEALLAEKATPLSIPLAPTALPATGEFEIRVQAHRDLPPLAHNVALTVPRPVGALLTPGSVIVVPADNVELSPRSDELQGLTPDPLPSTVKLPTRQQMPLFYRELGGGATATFAADFQLRERTVTIAITGDVRVDAQRAQMEERLAYTIAYEPLRNLELDVPRTLWEAGQMQVLLEGNVLPVILQPADDAATDPTRATVRVDLLSERIGKLELIVRYTAALPKLAGDRPQIFPLPLVLPRLEGERKNALVTLRIAHDGPFEVGASGEGWTNSQRFSPTASLDQVGEWSHDAGAASFPMQLSPQQSLNQGTVVVEQAWLQSWLTSSDRQDRAVFRFVTTLPQLEIKLPPQVQDANLEVALDGRRMTRYVVDAEGLLTIELPRTADVTSRVVELWYTFNNRRPRMGSMELVAPHVQGAGDARRAYWQLILPDNEHLLLDPADLTPDMTWRWRGTHWSRVGTLSQSDLEAWSGARPQSELPTATNSYLYSTFGSLQTLQVRTELRRNMLLGWSGLALVIGLAMLYLPAGRHPALLLVAGVSLVALAGWNPDLAILFAQATVVGLGCVLLARLMRSLFAPRRATSVVLRAPANSGVEHRSTEQHIKPEHGSHATTAAIPIALGSPTTGPES